MHFRVSVYACTQAHYSRQQRGRNLGVFDGPLDDLLDDDLFDHLDRHLPHLVGCNLQARAPGKPSKAFASDVLVAGGRDATVCNGEREEERMRERTSLMVSTSTIFSRIFSTSTISCTIWVTILFLYTILSTGTSTTCTPTHTSAHLDIGKAVAHTHKQRESARALARDRGRRSEDGETESPTIDNGHQRKDARAAKQWQYDARARARMLAGSSVESAL